MPSSRDSFRRNRVAPVGDSILPLLAMWRFCARATASRNRTFRWTFFSGIRQMKMGGRRYTAFLNDLFGTPSVGADRRGKRLTIFSACVQYKK
jgi:hypothetical protein